MIVKNKALLAEIRRSKRCECCYQVKPLDPHHYHAKGVGGGSRLDIPENLLALCRSCHDAAHWGRIDRSHLLDLIAVRLGKTPEECQQTIWNVLAKKKGT